MAVIGIPLDTPPGLQTARLDYADGKPATTLVFDVTTKAYDEQRLKVTNQRHVDPPPQDLKRIAAERVRIDRALSTYSADQEPLLRLAAPVAGTRSSSFGLRRFFNGQSRNPHSGMDIAAAAGTPILNPARGRVLDTGDFFFNGQTVFVDHGQGVVAMYCHLSRIDVKPGDVVGAGSAARAGRRDRAGHRRASALGRCGQPRDGGPGAAARRGDPGGGAISAARGIRGSPARIEAGRPGTSRGPAPTGRRETPPRARRLETGADRTLLVDREQHVRFDADHQRVHAA